MGHFLGHPVVAGFLLEIFSIYCHANFFLELGFLPGIFQSTVMQISIVMQIFLLFRTIFQGK